MPAAKAPLLDSSGKKAKELTLEAAAFGAEVKPHLVHEAVRAELNAARAGTKGTKSRGLVSGGRAKPWRQKGTGRARAGTTRAPHWTGGGVAFAPGMRSFEVKVNRKAAKAALRSALASHVSGDSIAILDSTGFDTPSTKLAAGLLEAWGPRVPLLVVTTEDEVGVIKSFRNLEKVLVTIPSELEVSALVWARSLLVTEGALEQVVARAQNAQAQKDGAGS